MTTRQIFAVARLQYRGQQRSPSVTIITVTVVLGTIIEGGNAEPLDAARQSTSRSADGTLVLSPIGSTHSNTATGEGVGSTGAVKTKGRHRPKSKFAVSRGLRHLGRQCDCRRRLLCAWLSAALTTVTTAVVEAVVEARARRWSDQDRAERTSAPGSVRASVNASELLAGLPDASRRVVLRRRLMAALRRGRRTGHPWLARLPRSQWRLHLD